MLRELAWLAVACLLLLLVHAVATKCEDCTQAMDKLNDKINSVGTTSAQAIDELKSTISTMDSRLRFIEKKVDKSEEVDWFLQQLEEERKRTK